MCVCAGGGKEAMILGLLVLLSAENLHISHSVNQLIEFEQC